MASVACLAAVVGHAQTAPDPGDPLARALAEAASAFAAETSTDQLWTDAKAGIETQPEDAQTRARGWPALVCARAAWLRRGSRCSPRVLRCVIRPSARTSPPSNASGRDWARRWAAQRPRRRRLDTIRPAALRALAEAAMPQVRINYDAGLEYGRNTQPEYGLYYVGVADAQRQFVALARTLTAAAGDAARRAPACDRSRGDRRRATRSAVALPAAGIVDRHSEFIVASSALKEARQYDARACAMARCCDSCKASQRTAMLRVAAARRLRGPRHAVAGVPRPARRGRVDHSIGLLFLERAEAALDANTAGRRADGRGDRDRRDCRGTSPPSSPRAPRRRRARGGYAARRP